MSRAAIGGGIIAAWPLEHVFRAAPGREACLIPERFQLSRMGTAGPSTSGLVTSCSSFFT